jgi:CRISPR-associated protein Cas2
MVVFILERVPATVRGEMSRWLIEPRHGVFIGDVSAMVRDRLWALVGEKVKAGGALLLHSSPGEQGFKARSLGDTTRSLTDNEGLTLVHIPTLAAKKKDNFANRLARDTATVRFSPVEGTEAQPQSQVPSARNKPARRTLSSKDSPPIRYTRKTDPLYGLESPPDAADIARHCADSGEHFRVILMDVDQNDPALLPIGVHWRAIVQSDDPFGD